MSKEIPLNPFDDYPKVVALGLGYPNDRQIPDAEPTGWLRLSTGDVTHVSRETSTEAQEARRAQS